jgi:hypothetical protein
MKKVIVKVIKEQEEEIELEVNELIFKSDGTEFYMLDFRNEKPLLKGIFFLNRDNKIWLEKYSLSDLPKLIEKQDITEEVFNEKLKKVQEFLMDF